VTFGKFFFMVASPEATNKSIVEATIRFIKSSKKFKTLEAYLPETL
jgi:hypothetical protein